MNRKLKDRITALEDNLESVATKFKQHTCTHPNPKLEITEEMVRVGYYHVEPEKSYSIVCPDCGLVLKHSWDITLEGGIQLEIEEKQKELKELKKVKKG